MYSLKQRKTISRDIASPVHIGVYRRMLQSYGSSLAGTIMQDRMRLAEILVYALLGYCSSEDIMSACSAPGSAADSAFAPHAPSGTPVRAVTGRRVRNKFEEYPGIAWKRLDDPLVRTADSIYSDRINSWARLKEIEAGMGDMVSRSVIGEFIDRSVRLELCFDELRSFNDTGSFMGVHPFIAMKTEQDRIAALLRTDPEKYFDERKNVELNISRYSSYLNNSKYPEDRKRKYSELLDRHRALLQLYKDVFSKEFHR